MILCVCIDTVMDVARKECGDQVVIVGGFGGGLLEDEGIRNLCIVELVCGGWRVV